MKSIIYLCLLVTAATSVELHAQVILRGVVIDAKDEQTVIGANVIIEGTTIGVVTDSKGEYFLKTDMALPLNLRISYTGYDAITIRITDAAVYSISKLNGIVNIPGVTITGERISDGNKENALSIATFGILDIRENPSLSFYDGLGALKDVDITAASLGFKIINTRGFNSTSPVRSLQIIDGVDNQAPGLNFSLGNFLGASELDVLKVDIISGASGSYYGPNAFNGVISMETKNPFMHTGLSGMVKTGERNLWEGALRFADVIKNKNGHDLFAYKLNLYALRADDWPAVNYNPVTSSSVPASNPGRYDAVNIYGDEYYRANDFSGDGYLCQYQGLGNFYRTGYREADLVDYNTRNYKANIAFHLRTTPSKDIDSPELILSSNFGSGTTVYQGDNRFSLRDILFFQHRLEFRKRDKYFIRAYYTHEDAGKSFDPYFTALRLQQASKSNITWSNDYQGFWRDTFPKLMHDLGYPDCGTDTCSLGIARQWLLTYADTLAAWHLITEKYANTKNPRNPASTKDFLVPGSEEFIIAFQDITSRLNNQAMGTRFFDKSALFHTQAEYSFVAPLHFDMKVGANFRLYAPRSEGTIFSDTSGIRIRNSEVGIYAGIEKKLFNDKLVSSFTLRLDKNENLRWISTPAASVVYSPSPKTFLRCSFSSAIRNPTLADQYLHLNVGPAILAGHISKVDSLITLESFDDFRNTLNLDTLRYFDIDPIRPEKVQAIEFGLRTTLFDALYVDLGYYRSKYRDFLGYLLGVDAKFSTGPLPLPYNVQVYRYSANSKSVVHTQGFSIGINYYLSSHITLTGNYSFNELRKTVIDDPIIPAYNTPKHKFNIGISGRDIKITEKGALSKVGFNINYKGVGGFQFEGSPQFTGYVPAYGLVDAQVNSNLEKAKTTIKIGVSNLLNNKHYETYGGPSVGRLAYFAISYNF